MRLPITIPVQPSRRLACWLLFAHGCALALVWPLVMPSPVKVVLALAIVVSAIHTQWLVRHPTVAALRLGRGGVLELEKKVGAGDTALLSPLTTVLTGLVVLQMRRTDGRRLALPLPADALGRGAHRRLRLWLRWLAK